MSVVEIFETLKQNNMSIGVVDGKLRLADPEQKLTSELRDRIKEAKDELMRIIAKRDSFVVSDFPHATMCEADFQEVRAAHPAMQDLYTATALQKGMFYHETFHGRETCYSRQIYFDMAGSIDAEALSQAWQAVVDRHTILRTGFVGFGSSEIHQMVASQATLPVTIDDQRGATGQDQYLATLREQERTTRFDYAAPPLMRIQLVQLSDARTHFICTYHHTILDGWSIPLLLAEVTHTYQAMLEARAPILAPALPYARYMAWLAGRDHEAALSYWRAYLDGCTPPKRLQFEAGEAGTAAARGGAVRVEIDARLGAQLVSYCARQHCTMSAMLHLAWAYALGRHLNQDDIVVGSVSSVRPPEIAHIEHMLGLMVNTVPVRVRFNADLTVTQALATLARDSADSADYRYVALDQLQAALGFSSKAPLFETAVVFQNYPDYGKADGDELTKNVSLANSGYSEDNNFAAVLNGSLVGERLSLEVSYDERMSAAAARDLADCVHRVLSRIVQSAPEGRVIALEGTEQFIQNSAVTRDGKPLPSMAEQIDACADKWPRQAAVTHDFETLNYRQLVDKSNRLANYLVSVGVRQHHTVAIMLDRSLDLVVAMVAVQKAGAACLLLDASEPDDRVGYKLAAASATYVISDSQSEARFGGVDGRIILDAPRTAKELARFSSTTPAPQAGPRIGGANLAYIQFVSGDSGYPVKCGVSGKTLAAMVAWHNARAATAPGARVPCAGSVLLEHSWLELFGTLCAGAEIQLANNVLDLCLNASMQPAAMCVTRDDLARLFERKYSFAGMQGLTLFDNQPSRDTLTRLLGACGLRYVDVYLSCAGHGSAAGACRVERGAEDQPLRFAPIAGVSSLHVIDLFGRTQPHGAPGQLWIGGEQMLHASGDSAAMHDDGSVQIMASSATHFDAAGYRASYDEIEAHLREIPEVDSCAVLLRQDKGRALVAYLVFKDGFTGASNNYAEDERYFEEVHHCKKFLLNKLPEFLVPETYVFLESIPRLPNGAVDRDSLPDPEEVSNDRRHFVGPANDIEAALVVLWEGSFLLNDISCSDDYFELGGTSLLQVKLGARINKDFKTAIPLTHLFRDSTNIISQAQVIEEALAAA